MIRIFVSTWDLIKEFIENYLLLESRIDIQ